MDRSTLVQALAPAASLSMHKQFQAGESAWMHADGARALVSSIFGPFVNGLELNRTAMCGGELRIQIRHRDRAAAPAPAAAACYKFSASFLGGSGGGGGRLKLTFAEDGGGGGGGGGGKVKRIVVVDALAKGDSSTADVTVFEGRATQVGVVTGAADEDNGAVNRNDGAFVIFDRG